MSRRLILSMGVALALVGTGLLTPITASGACITTADFVGKPYVAGSVMPIHWTNDCWLSYFLLVWPDGTPVLLYWVVGTSSGTIPYPIPPYAPAGTWKTSTATGYSDSAVVSPLQNPLGVRFRPLGEAEVVMTSCTCPNAGDVGDYAIHDFHGSMNVPWGSLGASVRRVAMGDVDGDGNAEIVTLTTNWASPRQVRTTDPSNQLPTLAWDFPSAYVPIDLTVGDFDGNGRGEIAVLYQDANVYGGNRYVDVWTVGGIKLSPSGNYYRVIPAGYDIQRISAGDFDGNGIDEIALVTDQFNSFGIRWDYTIGVIDYTRTSPVFTSFSNANPVQIADVASVRDVVAYRSKIAVMSFGRVKLFQYANGGITEASGWTSVTDGDPYETPRAIAGGDMNGDGRDEVFTLAVRTDASARLYAYNFATATVTGWDVGRALSDQYYWFADVAAGDANGDGAFITPTGDSIQIPVDAAIVARVGVPPYLSPIMTASMGGTAPVGRFGQTTGGSFQSGNSTSVSAGAGITIGGDFPGVKGDLTVIVGLSTSSTTWTGKEHTLETSATSLGADDGLIVARMYYTAYKFRAWNRDTNGDGKIDANDVLWFDTNTNTELIGLSVDGWNNGVDPGGNKWSTYKSWAPLPTGPAGRHVGGNPTSYPLGVPNTFGNGPPMWVNHDPSGATIWNPVTYNTLDLTYTETTSHGNEITDETFVNVDGSIRFGEGWSAGVAFSFGWRWGTLQRISESYGFTISVNSPKTPYDPARWDGGWPWEYSYKFAPYLYIETLAAGPDYSVKQKYFVLDYTVNELGVGYTAISPVASITSPTNNQVVQPGPVNIVGTASTTKPKMGGKDNTFQSYTLEWGAGTDPTSWTQFASSSTRVENGPLGTWDATGKSGYYKIRLTTKDWANHVSVSTVLVAVSSGTGLFVTIDPSIQYICPGDTAFFTGSAAGGTGIYTYYWNFGDGTTGTGQSVSHAYFTSGTKTVTLTVFDSVGVSGTATATVRVVPPRYCF